MKEKRSKSPLLLPTLIDQAEADSYSLPGAFSEYRAAARTLF